VMNLCVNARDSMAGGGKIILRLSEVRIDAPGAARHPKARAGRFACLEVADTGCGITPVTMQRLFEPFFTTKDVGKGTGLGLAIVDGVVEQHRGWIEINSREGEGSTFSVFLPLAESAPSPPDNVPFAADRQGTETVLVVEDDPAVAEGIKRILTRSGYRILEADTAANALRVWKESNGRIDLLLTDMVLPGGMTGLDLAELLKGQRSGLRIIICSGYNAELVADRPDKAIGATYLQKPFTTASLTAMVREVMDGRKAT
jgi:two-component system cell cycle sensor histidine kinase/response regulator CckA